MLTLSPGIGYQFSERWTAGLIFEYLHQGQSSANGLLPPSSSDQDLYSIGPFVRYSHPITSWVSFYWQFEATYGTEGKTSGYNNVPEAQHSMTFNLYPALYFPIKNGFGLNASLGGVDYDLVHVSQVGTVAKNFNLSFGSTAVIGISKNFGGKKAKSS